MMQSGIRLALLGLLAISSVAYVRAGDDENDGSDPDVMVLTKDNFDSIVNREEELILVEFYAPWCGHCKRLKPEYAKAATELKSHDPPIPIAKLDATIHGEVASRFGVSGYPTLKVFRNGSPSAYNGPREADGIVAYMKKQVGPAAKPVSSVAELSKVCDFKVEAPVFEGASRACFVYLSGGSDDKHKAPSATKAYSAFTLVANSKREDFVFARSTSSAVWAQLGQAHSDQHPEAIVAVRNFEPFVTEYTGATTTKNLEQWVAEQSLPLIGDFSKNQEAYRKRNLPVVKAYVKDLSWTSKFNNYFINRLKKAANEHSSKVLFALNDAGAASKELEELGLKAPSTSNGVHVIYETPEGTRYLNTEAFSADGVNTFVSKVLKGEVPKFVKSEEPPAKNDGPVTIVTGRTFQEIVETKDKNVMIEFYAPWCGHCRSLEPKYEELGKKIKKKYDNVVIAKMDATANDYPSEYSVRGYPTIYFKPKGTLTPKAYEGDREADKMFDYIKDNSVGLSKRSKSKN